MTKPLWASALVVCAAIAPLWQPTEAHACGGCFHPENQPAEQASVVTAHKMALSISSSQSVLWDQVEYAGSPAEFAWVLPVKPGAVLEVASDAWLEALDAATAVRVSPPAITCVTRSTGSSIEVPGEMQYGSYPGCEIAGPLAATGCSAEEVGEPGPSERRDVPETVGQETLGPTADPVSIVHQGSAGPYETVTLHSEVPGALTTWLADHGYAIDADIQPIVDAYVADGFDFIALRLLPDAGVQQMRPVRIIQPGGTTTLPLRMVAAGTGANVTLTLFVLGEGRWETSNFPQADVELAGMTWDFATSKSDYATRRDAALADQDGRAWLTAYAIPGALFAPVPNPITGASTIYAAGTLATTTIADAYMAQGLANGESHLACTGQFQALADTSSKVVDPCASGDCGAIGDDEIDAREFACGPLEDLSRAMVGMHPRDVWVTRLESALPRAALADDLELTPATSQAAVENWLSADTYTNPPCEVAAPTAAPAEPPARKGRWPGGAGGALATLVAASALASAIRRAGRRVRVA